MKKIWNFIVNNRIYIVLILFILFCGFVFVTMKAYLDPEDELAVYGNRLQGIEKFTITEDKKKELLEFVKEDKNIVDFSVAIQGKIVNMIIKASTKEQTIEKMEKLGVEILKKFTEEEIKFYDFQFFIKNEDANYNLIGYKNKKNENISWVNDVIVSEVEDNEEEQ